MVRVFVNGVQNGLATAKGYVFREDIGVHFFPVNKLYPTPKALLCFPDIITSRAFFYTYRDYVWTNPESTQHAVVRLSNQHFQTELLCKQHRNAALNGLTPAKAEQIILGSSLPCIQDEAPAEDEDL